MLNMLKWIRRVLLLLIALIAILAGFKFSFDNPQLVQPVLFSLDLPSASLGLWILCALLLGSLIGLVLSYPPNFLNRRSLKIKENKIARLEEQLKNLQNQNG